MSAPPGGVGVAVLQARLETLRQSLRGLFVSRQQARGRRRSRLQAQLLLGLELLWKLEEQVVLPALVPTGSSQRALDELDLMRDLALLAMQTHSNNRDVTLSVLEGMALLHFARVAELLDRAEPDAADWTGLDAEVSALLERWQGELKQHGEIEDEERDPVGLPPH